jgi:hypothetical protein
MEAGKKVSVGVILTFKAFMIVLSSGSRKTDSGLQRWFLKGLGLSLCAVSS